ncbi:MFS transporter [Desulfofundulus sp. TPOSR]|uniref:MFS transporter n=1 Tax=Desulfofundulus sp. TPOSR TaxID=2714340 RepID=UPI0014079774|nr:MFS transporter [Desulfofundulus sp. TPOSR]NHM26566.1 MFS transporter [Desulfofundulus sp. TPOSR]
MNLSQRMDNLPFSGFHFKILLIMCLGLFFDAYDAFVLSIALPELISKWDLTKIQTGYLNSAGYMGMLFGALFAGYFADRIGRVKVLSAAMGFYAIFMGMCMLSNSYNSLFVWRTIAGIGLGGMVPVAAAYLTEYMPARVRGRCMSIFNANYSLGVAFAFFLGYLIIVPYGWRWGFAIASLPVILSLVAWKYLPESIRYLLNVRRVEDAVNIVDQIEKKIINKTTIPFEEAVELEKEELSKKKEVSIPISYLFQKKLLGTTLLMSTMWFCLSFATFALTTWMPVLLTTELKYNLGSGLLWMAFAQLLGVIVTPVAGIAADAIGRKKTIFILFLTFGISAYLLFLFGGELGKFFMVIMMMALSMCNGINYVYIPENFPTEARGTGVGFASACGRVGAMIGPSVLGILYSFKSLMLVLHVIMVVLVGCALLIAIFGRETRKKSLEEISSISA